MQEEIYARLLSLAEPEYRAFHMRLCKTRYPILGVRIPALRAIAKEICCGNWRAFSDSCAGESYEQIMLEGFVLAGAKMPLEEKLARTADYIKKPDCWALTDCVVPSYRFRKQDLAQILAFFEPYLHSQEEFQLRFALIVLLDYFLVDEYAPWVAKTVAAVQHDGYYVNMARAWLLAELATDYDALTFSLLEGAQLDTFTHNQTISKLCDSRRIPDARKAYARSLRRKGEAT
ncbi:MAG: DNA alkylation repair protein [Oscillospiraceae bacterium]|jgi:3-methyladenine DNA glycosylase AlkD|nr:DNA alkylation repair protein [Oscillospiraceae bacterium]